MLQFRVASLLKMKGNRTNMGLKKAFLSIHVTHLNSFNQTVEKYTSVSVDIWQSVSPEAISRAFICFC